MNPITILILLTALVAALWFLAPALKKPFTSRVAAFDLTLSNIGEGEHIEFISLYPDAAIGTRFLIAKQGTVPANGDLCGVNDVPIGVWYDETGTTTDLTQKRAIGLLGARKTTMRVAINSTVTLGDLLVPGAGSYAKTLPAAGVTPVSYNVIGRALRAGVAGDVIEFDPQPMVVILGAASGTVTQTQDTITDSTGGTPSTTFAAITAGATYAQGDLVAIKNALSSSAAENAKIKADIAALKTATGV